MAAHHARDPHLRGARKGEHRSEGPRRAQRSEHDGRTHAAPTPGEHPQRGRLYDPLAGRFMSSDPVMQAPFWSQGLNPHSYVFNDPINAIDPSGFITFNDAFASGVKWFVIGTHIASGVLALGGAGGIGTPATNVGPGAMLGAGYGQGGAWRGAAGNYDLSAGGGQQGPDLRLAQNAGDPGTSGTEGAPQSGSSTPPYVDENRLVTDAATVFGPGKMVKFWRWVKSLARIGKAAKGAGTAFEIAKAGGRHAGTLKNYAGRSTAEIEKGIRSYERQVALHQRKIADPAKFAERWGEMGAKEQAGLIRHWQQDLARNQELADVLRGLLGSR